MRFRFLAAVAAVGWLLTGCESDVFGPVGRYDPTDLDGAYNWIRENWSDGRVDGYPAIELSWEVPTDHNNEPFRVYSAYGDGAFGLIATVTSCSDGLCRYTDTNILHGRTYDYYVVTLDERSGEEIGASESVTVEAADFPALSVPDAPTVTGLDGAAYIEWTGTGAPLYTVLAQREGERAIVIGYTDGTSFFDELAQNGVQYDYYVATSDEWGHVSDLSQPGQGIPRPDFHADIVYSFSDATASSGFQFVASEADDPILAGDSPSAQWRLETVNETLWIQPLGQTAIDAGTFTTALSCGPGSEPDCLDVTVAPANSEFDTSAVAVEAGDTYVLRVLGSDGQTHFAKMRVQGTSVDADGSRLILFDWAYQLRPDEPRLLLAE
ncbi:MAG: hypothetical protein GEU90_00265 [Gemmatimonas sp.]|nr:hypothetical protein [Gemmatimonas sp.]